MVLRVVVASAASVIVASFAQADVLLSSTFENNSPGTVLDGTLFTGGSLGARWQATSSGIPPATQTYSSDHAMDGSQSLKVVRGTGGLGNGRSFAWGDTAGGNNMFFSGPLIVTSTVSVYIPVGPTTGALFGLETFSEDSRAFFRRGIGLTQGRVAFEERTSPMDSAYLLSDQTYTQGVWNTLTEVDTYTDPESDTVTYFFNGAPVTVAGDSVHLQLNEFEAGFGDSDITSQFNPAVGVTADGATAYFDNYSVTTAVPEPSAAMGLLAISGIVAFRRRRK